VHVILWEFRVREGREADFEKAYGPDGDWARLFRRAAGYLGTELLADPDLPRRYVTVDRWASGEAHSDFLRRWKSEYEALDSSCRSLTDVETPFGAFETPGPR
jgi:heme-degrading monooxygenase HmoA